MYDLEIIYFFYYISIGNYVFWAIFVAIILAFFSMLLKYSPVSVDFVVSSAYECGFLPFDKSRTKFDVNFFVVGLLFVIFDLEIVFILPWSICLTNLELGGYIPMVMFLTILGVGFVYELGVGALEY